MRAELRVMIESVDEIKELKKRWLSLPENDGEAASQLSALEEKVKAVNSEVYRLLAISDAPVDFREKNRELLARQMEAWISFVSQELDERAGLPNKIDYDFRVLMSHIRYCSPERLVREQKAFAENIQKCLPQVYEDLEKVYNAYHDFWGRLCAEEGIYEVYEDRAGQLTRHFDDFCWLYENLCDYRSKKVLYGILRFWWMADFEYKESIVEHNFSDYFDFDIVPAGKEEVFVDLGMYTGDSIASFIENYGNYKRIYGYELSPIAFSQARESLQTYENIVLRNVGVGSEHGEMRAKFYEDEAMPSSKLSPEGGNVVEIVTLDEDITEKITFLKLDIEGSELQALEGAKRHIREDHPIITVCTYHNNHHIWEIPRLLKSYYPGYRFFMRYNGRSLLMLSEYVLFAIPEE